MFQRSSEIAGQLAISVTAFNQTDLNTVETAIKDGLKDFELNGISEEDLNRIKAGQETSFYQGLSSVLGKGFQLAQYEIFAGDPGFINQDVKWEKFTKLICTDNHIKYSNLPTHFKYLMITSIVTTFKQFCFYWSVIHLTEPI